MIGGGKGMTEREGPHSGEGGPAAGGRRDREVAAPEDMDAAAAKPRGEGNAQQPLDENPSAGARERTAAVPDHAPGAKEEQGGGA
jgi:hypothetical protein